MSWSVAVGARRCRMIAPCAAIFDLTRQAVEGFLVHAGDAAGQQVGEERRLHAEPGGVHHHAGVREVGEVLQFLRLVPDDAEKLADAVHEAAARLAAPAVLHGRERSEEHTSELQSLMRSSYDVFCLKKKKQQLFTLLNEEGVI